jgi:hypothetical protein
MVSFWTGATSCCFKWGGKNGPKQEAYASSSPFSPQNPMSSGFALKAKQTNNRRDLLRAKAFLCVPFIRAVVLFTRVLCYVVCVCVSGSGRLMRRYAAAAARSHNADITQHTLAHSALAFHFPPANREQKATSGSLQFLTPPYKRRQLPVVVPIKINWKLIARHR